MSAGELPGGVSLAALLVVLSRRIVRKVRSQEVDDVVHDALLAYLEHAARRDVLCWEALALHLARAAIRDHVLGNQRRPGLLENPDRIAAEEPEDPGGPEEARVPPGDPLSGWVPPAGLRIGAAGWRVLAAIRAGHLEVVPIAEVTGLKPWQVREWIEKFFGSTRENLREIDPPEH